MAFTRTAWGTTQGKTVTTLSIAGITLATGDSLIVLVANSGFISAGALTWNGIALIKEVAGVSSNVAIWALHNVSGATGTLTWTGSAGTMAWAAFSLTGTGPLALDQAVAASGSGTSPSSGAAPTTTAASTFLVGAVATSGPNGDAAGTWSNSFNAGQRLGTTGGVGSGNRTISEGYLEVSSTGAYTAAKTGIASVTWFAAVAAYKLAAAPDPGIALATRQLLLGVGR